MMWDAIQYVSSGVTLIAFVAAVVAWVYRQKLLSDSKLISNAPDSDRATLILARYGKLFDIDTSSLHKKQRYDLAIEQLRGRAKRFTNSAILVGVFAVLAAIVMIVALLLDPGGQPAVLQIPAALVKSKLEIISVKPRPHPTNDGVEIATFLVTITNPTEQQILIEKLAIVVQQASFKSAGLDSHLLAIVPLNHDDHLIVTLTAPNIGSREEIPVERKVPPNSTIEIGVWVRLGYDPGGRGFLEGRIQVELFDAANGHIFSKPFDAKIHH